jgi:hypothetical protein
MTYQGTVQNGVIQVEGGICLPEGTLVQIEVAQAPIVTEESDQELTAGQKLAALARKYECLPCDLPEDLAKNHDHYLHGLPKLQ